MTILTLTIFPATKKMRRSMPAPPLREEVSKLGNPFAPLLRMASLRLASLDAGGDSEEIAAR
jgi:hypothetical protein